MKSWWAVRPELRDERRRRIAEAVITIAAEQGVEAISLRTVAREAQTSTGQIQYQFGTVDELTLFAMEQVVAALDAVVGEEPELSGQERLRSVAQRLLAPDPDTTRCLRAYAQLRTLVTREARFRDVLDRFDRRHRAEVAAVLEHAKRNRILHAMVDPQREADVFWSLLVSIAIEAAQGLRAHDEGLDLVRYHFVRLARNARIAAPRR